MLEGRLRRSMVEVLRDNRIRLTALTSPGPVPGDLSFVLNPLLLCLFVCCYFVPPDKYEMSVFID